MNQLGRPLACLAHSCARAWPAAFIRLAAFQLPSTIPYKSGRQAGRLFGSQQYGGQSKSCGQRTGVSAVKPLSYRAASCSATKSSSVRPHTSCSSSSGRSRPMAGPPHSCASGSHTRLPSVTSSPMCWLAAAVNVLCQARQEESLLPQSTFSIRTLEQVSKLLNGPQGETSLALRGYTPAQTRGGRR